MLMPLAPKENVPNYKTAVNIVYFTAGGKKQMGEPRKQWSQAELANLHSGAELYDVIQSAPDPDYIEVKNSSATLSNRLHFTKNCTMTLSERLDDHVYEW